MAEQQTPPAVDQYAHMTPEQKAQMAQLEIEEKRLAVDAARKAAQGDPNAAAKAREKEIKDQGQGLVNLLADAIPGSGLLKFGVRLAGMFGPVQESVGRVIAGEKGLDMANGSVDEVREAAVNVDPKVVAKGLGCCGGLAAVGLCNVAGLCNAVFTGPHLLENLILSVGGNTAAQGALGGDALMFGLSTIPLAVDAVIGGAVVVDKVIKNRRQAQQNVLQSRPPMSRPPAGN